LVYENASISLITGGIFYPVIRKLTFITKNKIPIFIISLIVFLIYLTQLLRNVDSKQDKDYDPQITSDMILVSSIFLSISLYLIVFKL
jgi:hypothetical protein